MINFFKLRSPWTHLLIITFFVSVIYSNTFSVPFHFDDKLNIVDNPSVKNLSNFWPPAGNRWFGYLTFALNYAAGGLSTAGYHGVNLAIHLSTAFLVYWLLQLTFKTPYFAPVGTEHAEKQKTRNALLALFTSLLFAVHPIQTQAVTYIVQRFASLATLLYLLSITTYVQARLLSLSKEQSIRHTSQSTRGAWLFYILSFLSAVLAMKTKEISFTLPVVVVLYELSFFGRTPHQFKKRMIYLLPVLLTLAIIPLTMTDFGRNFQNSFTASNEISRLDYLLTQFRVLTTYLRLLAFPINQSIDYSYPVSRAFLDPPVLLSFILLASIFITAGILFIRSRSSFHSLRLIAFGIFWFFITLSVESSIIPIADVIFEHRLYLPSIGAAIAIAGTIFYVVERLRARHRHAGTIGLAAGMITLVLLSAASYSRNAVWNSEIQVWQDAVQKYPAAFRAHSMLGTLYQRNGNRIAAMNAYRAALAINPSHAEAHVNLGSVLVEEGRLDEGMSEFLAALKLNSMDSIDSAYLYINIGTCYLKKGMPDRAIEFYHYALPIIPDDAIVYSALGRAFQEKGMFSKADEYFGKAHYLNPERF